MYIAEIYARVPGYEEDDWQVIGKYKSKDAARSAIQRDARKRFRIVEWSHAASWWAEDRFEGDRHIYFTASGDPVRVGNGPGGVYKKGTFARIWY